MKNSFFTMFILIVLLIVPAIDLAQAAPTPVKVLAEGTTTSTDYLYERAIPNGKAHDEIGAWKADYLLNIRWEFWNVGEEGGEKYAEGIITSTFVNGVNSRVVVRTRVDPSTGEIFVGYEPSSDTPPDLTNYVLKLRFSGGPNGVFSKEDGTVLQTKLTPDGYGGYTIAGTPILVVENPEAFKDWNLPTLTAMPWAKDEVARFSGLSGQVEYLLPGANRDSDWKIARLESVLPRGTHIRTIDDSTAIISAADMSTFVLNPESEIVLTTPEEKESKLKILAGQMWGNVKKMVETGSMEIEMNQAVAGIKGTTFVVSEINGVSSLKVIEGKVEFTAKVDGNTVEVAGGNTVSASNAGLSSIESFDVAKETADWNAVSASIPEFPLWIIVAMLMIFTTLVAIVIKRKSVN
jgi:hypothetical protein